MSNEFLSGCGVVSFAVGVVLAITLLVGFPIMWLWNWLMPVLFSLPTITYWQAMGLFVLSLFLFKNVTYTGTKN